MSFVDRYRVAARKVIAFHHRIAKKGPALISCNEKQTTCTRRNADPRNGCPTCEFTIQYNIFINELKDELAKLKRGTREGARKWPYDFLVKLVTEAAAIKESSKKKKGSWSVVTALLVGIYNDEFAKLKSIERHRALEEINTPDDDDDSDELISPNPYAAQMDNLINRGVSR